MSAGQARDEDGGRRLDVAAWRELLGYILRYRFASIALVATAIVTAAVDASIPLVTRRVIDDLVAKGADARLAGPALAYAGLLALLAGCIFTFIRLAGRLSTRVAHDIRVAAFARLQDMSFSFYDRNATGWLMARMTSDCDRLSRILAWGLLDLAWGATLMIGIAVVLLILSWRLGLVALVVLPALGLVSLRFQRRILESARRVRKANSRLTAAYNEDLMAARTTKALAREEDSQREFGVLSGEMYEASVRNALQSAAYLPVIVTLASIGVGLTLWLGAGEVLAGMLSLGTLVAFVHFTLRFFDPVNELAATFAQLQMAQASAERVLGLIHAEPEIRDAPGVVPAPPPSISRIELVDVAFAYGGGPRVLHDVSLSVAAGMTVALVGPTGGGKTTLASLVCRFYEPTAGRILVDGVDLRGVGLAWWRSKVAVVLQQPFLFSGTIRENIRYGRLDASDAEVEAAARLVAAEDSILALGDGFDTRVGERGSRLSTGQAQLVSIARALLADKPVLVLDEATSSVDAETERRIQAGLARVMAGRTCFVIAHRLSTIRSADLIVVVDEGRIVEQGTHSALFARPGHYRELNLEQRLRASSGTGDAWATT